jgi:hypothetical protein
LRPWNVTVSFAATAAPGTSPVDASAPDGMSTETTVAPEALIRSISAAASSRGAPWKPVPKSASRTRSAPSTSSDSRASRPASLSRFSAIRPSPPFAPPPQTPTMRCAAGKRSSTASATARPARCMSVGTSCPASAARISFAV